ncbi:hypothetical protein PG993_000330 [Apiospora rasikravindrae]|uniref:EF-hand domain-containing protein n=1 Tax=Apiospora rasikravindrae TaxID=990691 RepID=A0ABR1U8B1_9PEZI
MKYITALVVAATAISAAHAFCCDSNSKGFCKDGSEGTPCCATESCNIFCCNCDGSCRSSKRSFAADPFASKPVEEAFALADAEGNGKITLPQYLAFMRVPKEDDEVKAVWAAWFNKHDKNHDGVITPDEVTA